jgi:glyoxylate utilization-related uncharacterized protein
VAISPILVYYNQYTSQIFVLNNTIIELEEVNDAIFNKDGAISREVYDGITQAVDYYIEHRSQNFKSKGMAVIGTTQGMRLTIEQKEKLRLLKETFHNIEVLTYDDIISQAENTIRFWETYEEHKDIHHEIKSEYYSFSVRSAIRCFAPASRVAPFLTFH